jgi:serine/threonine-protein kinase
MATTHDPPAVDELELEPTTVIEPLSRAGGAPEPRVGLVQGPAPSLTGETDVLLLSRLRSVAFFLLVAYAVALIWVVSTRDDLHEPRVVLLGSRVALVMVILGLLFNPVVSVPGRLRWLELALFGGLTLCLIVAQFLVDRGLIRAGDVPGLIAHEKTGVIELLILMVAYGMLIPNDPRRTAAVVLTMALAPFLALSLLLESEETSAEVFAGLRNVEYAGQNALIVLIGAGLAIYGSSILNRLRSDLHGARRFGQYQLGRKLGVGGMGEVYLAEHQLLKRPCALKLIRPDASRDPLALARFEREVRSAARLSHPNTIEIYDYGQAADGTFYYVMEFLPGLSLAELVEQFGPLPAGRVIYLLRQVCAALAEAHGLGLIHRDLKPANLFVALRGGECDVAKVLDFGLVKPTRDPEAAHLTMDQTVSGTPMYLAPEQAAGEELDARADLYALGAIAYFALTGRPPFVGTNAVKVMIAASRDPAVPPSEVHPGVPADLEAVVLRCLAKTPQERPPDARSLAQALAGCAAASEWGPDQAEEWWAAQAQARLQAEAEATSATA